jgi:hypothetical protein
MWTMRLLRLESGSRFFMKGWRITARYRAEGYCPPALLSTRRQGRRG